MMLNQYQKPLVIGVLALQGGFSKHLECLHQLEIKTLEVRKSEHLQHCHGLIIPGGESTTLSHLFQTSQMKPAIQAFAEKHPVLGTCAGLILMAKKQANTETADPEKINLLNLMDITVERNAYGRQADSFATSLTLALPKRPVQDIPALFIRAPKITAIGSNVTVLAKFQDTPVMVQAGKHLALSFHPELTNNTTIHQYFLELIANSEQ